MSEEIDDFFRTEVTNHTTLSSCHSFTNSLADPVLYKTMKTPLKNHTVTVVSGLERSFFFQAAYYMWVRRIRHVHYITPGARAHDEKVQRRAIVLSGTTNHLTMGRWGGCTVSLIWTVERNTIHFAFTYTSWTHVEASPKPSVCKYFFFLSVLHIRRCGNTAMCKHGITI